MSPFKQSTECVLFFYFKYVSKLQEQTQTTERKVVKSIKRKDRFLFLWNVFVRDFISAQKHHDEII